MAIIGTHRGPISGLTHVHLLRESPSARKARVERTDDPAHPDEASRLDGRSTAARAAGDERKPNLLRPQPTAD
jgi:hypothetical protein